MADLALLAAFLDDSHYVLAAELDDFVLREITPLPHAATDREAREQAPELLARLGAAGYMALALPEGGDLRPDLRAACLVREALAAASPLADSIFALQCLGSQPLLLGGSAELRRRFLPEVIAGRLMAAFAMTEREAGSDVANLETTARWDGHEWVIEGHKWLITNAGAADFYCVFAKTDQEAGSRGISCFLVEADNPGLEFVRAQVLSEPHPLGELRFENCRVPAENLLGREGEGFKLGMRTLDRLRPTVAAAACGFAARALQEAIHHAKTRRQFGKTMAEQPIVQQKLAQMATLLDAARLLTWRAAWEADRGAQRITREAATAKSFATEAAQTIVDSAVQIIGGRACLAEHPVDRLYRAVRALRIYEGATEVQQLVIARQLLQD